MYKPDYQPCQKDAAHDIFLIMTDIAEQRFQGRPEEITSGTYQDGPYYAAYGVKYDETTGFDIAHAQREGNHGPGAVEETETEYDPELIFLYIGIDLNDSRPPLLFGGKYIFPLVPAQVEIELVPDKPSAEGDKPHQRQVQVSPVGRETCQDQYGLALENSPRQKGDISVMLKYRLRSDHLNHEAAGLKDICNIFNSTYPFHAFRPFLP